MVGRQGGKQGEGRQEVVVCQCMCTYINLHVCANRSITEPATVNVQARLGVSINICG